jgi:hypothetical protein
MAFYASGKERHIMTMPNFLIIGAQKCGTTALYHALRQHPQIYMSPVKEPCYFMFCGKKPDFRGPNVEVLNRAVIAEAKDYEALFDAASGEKALGEASTWYLSGYQPEETARNIRRAIPHIRLIAVLRHPADRAYSAFLHQRRWMREPFADFTRALKEEMERIRDHWPPGCHYQRNGFYYANLKPYFDLFPRERIRIYLHEDWQDRPQETLEGIFRFLEVDELYTPEMSERHNAALAPRSQTLNRLLKRPHGIKKALRPFVPRMLRDRLRGFLEQCNQVRVSPLDPHIRQQVTETFREDIQQLQGLIGRDLSHWLTPAPSSRHDCVAV